MGRRRVRRVQKKTLTATYATSGVGPYAEPRPGGTSVRQRNHAVTNQTAARVPTPMRVAVISDIHANLHALDAVLALTRDPNPWVAARGVWLLPHLGPKGLEACEKLLTSKNERTRLVAFRALRRTQADILPYADKLKGDASAAVRRDVALSMRNLPAAKSAPILIAVAKGWDGTDKNYLEAIGLGAANQENAVWIAMRDAFGGHREGDGSPPGGT